MSNSLTQDKSLLLGSRESIEALAQKDSARILAISDSHANTAALSFVLQKFGVESDALVFCGDGASDIVYLLQKASCDECFFACIPPVIAFVRGNNDSSSYSFMNKAALRKKDAPLLVQVMVPPRNELTVAGHKLVIVHGHAHSLYSGVSDLVQEAEKSKADLIFFGHTHVPSSGYASSKHGPILLVNPGSCSIPRACQPPSFALLDVKKGNPNPDCVFYEIRQPTTRPFIPPPLCVG
ncbi:MAG: YfcE family phosphodiesterase [Treponema sp.]|nr:YfcE family phosphodiesterase [Treponema sp.]